MTISQRIRSVQRGLILAGTLLTAAFSSSQSMASELHAGAATVSITPDQPVALAGQMHTRIAKEVQSPVTATALAFESRDGARVLDQAILVSCDLVVIDAAVLEKARAKIKQRIADFDTQKLILSATHTHTAPVTDDKYLIPKEGVMQPAEYVAFLTDRVAQAAAEAWQARSPSKVGWGLGHAVIAQNRRAIYADGHAQMYGATDRPDFRGIEGPEDHGVEVLFVWDMQGKLKATAINIACPGQEVESLSAVNADYWHNVREALKAKHGKDLKILGWTGAGGDQSPHLMYRKRAEERMRTFRKLNRLDELSRRIVAAWNDAHDGAKQEQVAGAVLVHKIEPLELPTRIITEAEVASAQKNIDRLSADPKNQRVILWHQDVIDRYKKQQAGTQAREPYAMELHALRLGDVAIATNPFELYTQYGIQMKSRSRALQTFVLQLSGPGSYLPTEPAVRGGGYSAIAESNLVGPEAGQILTDRTVELINTLWPKL